MKAYVQLDEKNNVTNIGTVQDGVLYTEVVLEDSVVDLTKLPGYRIDFQEEGKYMVFDQNKYDAYLEEEAKKQAYNEGKELANKIAETNILETASDEDAYTMRYLYDEWNGNSVSYKKDNRLRYEDKLYKVLLDHTSQEDWIPGSAPSLYVEIPDPSIEYPEWKQPTGSHDAYAKGDKVTYKGKKYISKIDANTYSPETYPQGWKEVI